MRNPLSKLALVLTTILMLLFAMQLSAQQPSPPSTGSPTPATNPAPVVQPDADHPARIGGPITPPEVTFSVKPQIPESARQAKFHGTVKVYCWVDENGNPSHVRVVNGVGMGLDEKAVEAVRQYKFKPATQNGKPVKVDLYIDVNFQIF
jgi:TonB family protein